MEVLITGYSTVSTRVSFWGRRAVSTILLVAAVAGLGSPGHAPKRAPHGGDLGTEIRLELGGPPLHSAGRLEVEATRSRAGRHILDQRRYLDDHGYLVSVQVVERFLNTKRSPLAPYAADFVMAGNRYNVDPRLVIAIAGVESSFGKKCRGFNAWGWNNGRSSWSSWTHAIHDYTRLVSERYPNWRNIKGMARVYNPNTPEAWGRKVRHLMASMEVGLPNPPELVVMG